MFGKKTQKKSQMYKQYWKEILWLLALKAVLLTGLWYEFFRTPLVLDDKTAGEHILR
jgi:hypothetical protein